MGLAVPVALGLAVYGVWRSRQELAGRGNKKTPTAPP
jgi:hypothetical protein